MASEAEVEAAAEVLSVYLVDKDDIRSALEAAERVRWQPIEMAPKDGTSIFAECGNNCFIVAWRTWYNELTRGDVTGWWSVGAKNAYQPEQLIIKPTHWQPLPSPPENK
jgi:Protein of unknown function (DUF551)